jgi:hypothetical protein
MIGRLPILQSIQFETFLIDLERIETLTFSLILLWRQSSM